MATAAELLAGLSTGDDTTLVIDNYLRTISIPKKITNLGVEHDDDVLTLDFKMPRYLDDTDLSKFSIRINYMNANGDGDAYTVNDNNKVVGANFITFSWLVGPTATAYKGDTKFNVCMKTMKTVDGEQVIDKEYNTTTATLPVLEGLEVDEGIVSQYSDILEQWKRELFGIGDTEEANMRAVSQEEQENIAQKGAEVLATIPEEYQETAEAAQEGIRTKADAIVGDAEGSVITVSDSSDDHLRNLRVYGKTTQVTTTGKNLFNPECLTNAGWSKYNETYHGQSSLLTDLVPDITFKADTQYTISTYGHGTSSGDVTIFIYVYYTDETSSTAIKIAASRTPAYYTYTTAEGKTVDRIRFSYGYNQNTSLWNTMVEEGTVATEYEPYSNGVSSPSPDYPQTLTSVDSGEEVVVSVAGKNLAANATSRVATLLNGVTFTITKDSSEFIIGGTQDGTKDASGNLVENLTLMPGTYTLSVTGLCAPDYINVQRMVGNRRYEVVGVTQKAPKTFTITEKTVVVIQMVVYSTSTYNNTTLTLQLEEGSEATAYEPHKAKQELTAKYVLSGIPVDSGGNYTDANGQQWICDEIDFEHGIYIQRVKVVECDGTESITREERSDGSYRFIIRFATPVSCLAEHVYDGKSSHFVYGHSPIGNNAEDKVICVWTTGNAYCRHDGIASEDDMATWLAEQYAAGTPVTMMYPLATPIETALTAEELEAFKALKTNYPHTTVMNDAGAHMELSYNADTKTYVDNGIKQTVTDVLEAIENGSY